MDSNFISKIAIAARMLMAKGGYIRLWDCQDIFEYLPDGGERTIIKWVYSRAIKKELKYELRYCTDYKNRDSLAPIKQEDLLLLASDNERDCYVTSSLSDHLQEQREICIHILDLIQIFDEHALSEYVFVLQQKVYHPFIDHDANAPIPR